MLNRKIEAQTNFRLQIRLVMATGPGKASLLDKIAEPASISQAEGAWHRVRYRMAAGQKPELIILLIAIRAMPSIEL